MSAVAALRKPQVMPLAREALNGLWLRLDQARSVADCISGKCEIVGASEEVARAIAQIDGLAGAVSALLGMALDEVSALEPMV